MIQTQRLQAVVADMREKVIWVWATKVSQVTRLAQNVWHTPLITLWTIGVKRWHWSWHWHCFLGVWDVHIYHSLALNIWLSVNRTQLERLYKFVIIGSHLALWDSPDKPAQTSYFLSNPLLSFHQPFYTSLSPTPTLARLFLNFSWFYHVDDGMIMMMWWWWWWHFCSGFVVWHDRRFVHFGAPVLGEAAPRNRNFCRVSSAIFRRSIDEDASRKVLIRIAIKTRSLSEWFFPWNEKCASSGHLILSTHLVAASGHRMQLCKICWLLMVCGDLFLLQWLLMTAGAAVKSPSQKISWDWIGCLLGTYCTGHTVVHKIWVGSCWLLSAFCSNHSLCFPKVFTAEHTIHFSCQPLFCIRTNS